MIRDSRCFVFTAMLAGVLAATALAQAPPTITVQPQSATVVAGSTFAFTVTATPEPVGAAKTPPK